MKTKKLLWLDDYRDPYSSEIDWLVFSPIGRDCEIYWAKNYNMFVDYIKEKGLPDAICFDHDLGDETEKTGFDCAKWLVEYCLDNNLPIPEFNCQSANPVGRENIEMLLKPAKLYIKS